MWEGKEVLPKVKKKWEIWDFKKRALQITKTGAPGFHWQLNDKWSFTSRNKNQYCSFILEGQNCWNSTLVKWRHFYFYIPESHMTNFPLTALQSVQNGTPSVLNSRKTPGRATAEGPHFQHEQTCSRCWEWTEAAEIKLHTMQYIKHSLSE